MTAEGNVEAINIVQYNHEYINHFYTEHFKV